MTQRVRIIGGKYRSRQLNIAEVEGLRPTPNRSRETLFNWLQFEIAEARVLDLFAGSGALGLEALSRGAKSATFIEKSPVAVKMLLKNIEALKIPKESATVLQSDAIPFLEQSDIPFDLCFIDPPFHAELYPTIFEALKSSSILPSLSIIVIEEPTYMREESFPLEDFRLHRSLKSRESRLSLYKRI